MLTTKSLTIFKLRHFFAVLGSDYKIYVSANLKTKSEGKRLCKRIVTQVGNSASNRHVRRGDMKLNSAHKKRSCSSSRYKTVD